MTSIALVLLCGHLCITGVLISAVVSAEYTSSYSALDGVSQDGLLRSALLLYPHTEHTDMDIIIPDITFNCSGTITKLFLVARASNGPEPPVFRLWPADDGPSRDFSLTDLREVAHNNLTGISLYEHEVEILYTAGDQFGFAQPASLRSEVVLQYQDGGGPTGRLREELNNSQAQPETFHDQPLVAIETGNPECSTGFLEREALELVVTNHVAILSSLTTHNWELQLFRDISFKCSGTITRLTLGAKVVDVSGLSALPELQLWRPDEGGNDTYTMVSSTSLPLDSLEQVPFQPGVYSVETDVQFTSGDILGVFHPLSSNVQLQSLANVGPAVYSVRFMDQFTTPPTTVVLDESTLSSGREWPLIVVETTATSEDCTQGFISRDILLSAELKQALGSTQSSLELVVPELKFTTGGLLRKWSFVAEKTSTVQTQYPQFQVWRRTGQTFTLVNGTHANSSSAPLYSGYLNVYDYLLDPPVPVEAGDFVGVVVPARIDAQLRLSMVEGVGYDIHQVTIRFDNVIHGTLVLLSKFIPLLNVELLVSSTSVTASGITPALSLPLATSSPLQPTSIPLPTGISTVFPTTTATLTTTALSTTFGPDESAKSGQIGPIIGGVIGGVVICALILAIVILSVLLIYKKKKYDHEKKSSPEDSDVERDLDNPVYSIPAKVNSTGRINTPQSKNGDVSSEMLTLSHSSIPALRHQDSGEYAEPVDHIRATAPSTSPRPQGSPQSSPSPTTSSPPYHRILELSDASPRVSPRSSPLFPSRNLPTSPCLSPFASLDRRRQAQNSPSLRNLPSPSPPSPYASLDRRWMMHSRDPSTVSDSDAMHSAYLGETAGHPFRAPSKGSSLSGYHSRSPSQGRAYDEEEGHIYHILESQGGYSSLYQGEIYVPTEEQRQRAASTSRERRIDIYAALSECLDSPSEDLMFFEESDIYWRPAQDYSTLYDQLAQRKYREIMRHQIKLMHSLGSGQFGEVNKGVWRSPQGTTEVAVKTLKRGATEEDALKFLQEAAIMGQFKHPNIVELVGVVTLGKPVMIVLELLLLGDLRNYLLRLRPLTPGDSLPEKTAGMLLGFCSDIACGMEYLERKAFVHRDLAARNILVAEDNTCKIGDFGMARDLEDENYYISQGGKIPIKWSPPEALNFQKYSTASDVWSYGVVMYEIWSLGHKPYEGYTNDQTQSLVERGDRLPAPPGCPRAIYKLMMDCWHPEHSARPSFLVLLKELSKPPSDLLSWSEVDTSKLDQHATALGAPLEAGRNLYPELRGAYN